MRSKTKPDWRSTTWGEIAHLVYGKALRERCADGPVTVYGTNGPTGYTESRLGDGPTVVIGRKGAYRGVHYASGPFWVIDTGFFLSLTDGIDMKWAYYELLTHDINGLDTGSAIPSTRREDFYALPVHVPPLQEQRTIALILSTLDGKIDSNQRLATLLEETAAAIFKARFVDLVGVDEFEEYGTERVPKGWRVGALSDLGRFVNGKAFTKDANGHGRAILRIRELNSGIDGNTPRSDTAASADHIASVDDILFAWSGSLGVYRWSGPESLINQHIFKVIPEGWPAWFVYGWIQEHMPEFRAIAQDKATTMGHIQRRHLAEAAVPIPDDETVSEADDVLKWLDEHRRALVAEAGTLRALRDRLLPKLISGEMRVPATADPEEVIGPATDQIVGAAR